MIIYYNRDGKEADYDELYNWRYYAKYVESKNENKVRKRYFIKMYNGSPIDTRKHTDYEVKKMINAKFQEVPLDIYNKYIQYISGITNVSIKSIERLINA